MVVILFIKMIAGILMSLYSIFFLKEKLEYEFLVYEIQEFTPATVSLIVFQFVLGFLFLYLVFLFRNLIRKFYNQELFSEPQIKTLNCIGELIISLSIGKSLLHFLSEAVLDQRASVRFDISFYDSFWFMLAIGLFFIFLSKIFENARLLKEENDLTV